MTVSWNAQDVDTFKLHYYRVDSGDDFTVASDSISGGETSYTITGLTAGTINRTVEMYTSIDNNKIRLALKAKRVYDTKHVPTCLAQTCLQCVFKLKRRFRV